MVVILVTLAMCSYSVIDIKYFVSFGVFNLNKNIFPAISGHPNYVFDCSLVAQYGMLII